MAEKSCIPLPLDPDLVKFCEERGKISGGTRVSYIRGLIYAAKAAAESQARNIPPMDDVDAAWVTKGINPTTAAGIVSLKQLRQARKGAAK